MIPLLALPLVLAGATAPTAPPRTVAIYPLQPLGTEQQVVDRLEALLHAEVDKLSAIKLQSRAETLLTIKQTADAATPCSDDACLAKIGVSCNVEKLVYGTVASLGESYVLDLKLIDVRSGLLERRQSASLSGDQSVLIEGIRAVSTQLITPELFVGTLDLKLGKPGAEVFLDGVSVGTTPLAPLDRVTPGKHALKIVLQGYQDFDRFVEVKLGRTTVVNVALSGTSIDATIEAQADATPANVPVLVVAEAPEQPGLLDSPLFVTGALTGGAGLALALIGGGLVVFCHNGYSVEGTREITENGKTYVVVDDERAYNQSLLDGGLLLTSGWSGVGVGAAVLAAGGAFVLWDLLDRPYEVSEAMPR
ncbi:MAG: PEGA domain-containing protein [Deltaproteobacteria bacterium]|nr:PEGA domain-containing protein [Deltaproteobacteria bacterium]